MKAICRGGPWDGLEIVSNHRVATAHTESGTVEYVLWPLDNGDHVWLSTADRRYDPVHGWVETKGQEAGAQSQVLIAFD